jgi:copper chaperone NosL
MTVSDLRFAAQVVAPGEEPLFFDDIGCLSEYLKRPPAPGSAATAYVMDHRARTWVRAASAVYTRLERLDTPMGSHVIAHADTASRDRDPDVRGGVTVARVDLFGTDGPPNARR